MTRGQARFLHVATWLVAATGLALGCMAYLMEPPDEFALANHPLQPHALHAHVLTAPLFVFALGLVWVGHVWARIRSGWRARRRTGIALASLVGPMIASGYLLQVGLEGNLRFALVVGHVATSLAFLGTLAAHLLLGRVSAVAARVVEHDAPALGQLAQQQGEEPARGFARRVHEAPTAAGPGQTGRQGLDFHLREGELPHGRAVRQVTLPVAGRHRVETARHAAAGEKR